jgi:hypothetical protein
MLIDKGVTSGEVVTIKLTSGEELVARLDTETDTFVKLSKTMVQIGRASCRERV